MAGKGEGGFLRTSPGNRTWENGVAERRATGLGCGGVNKAL